MKYSWTLFIFLLTFHVAAQDVHFSMMKFSPLTVNPSLVGLNGKYNASVNYRNQWNSVADPFSTIGVSFDTKFGSGKNDKGFLAAGINFFHDVAGDLKMSSSNVNLSLAYHLRINTENTLGLGIQAGYANRGLGNIDGSYASQYDGTGFDQTIPSGENFRGANFGYFDLGGGMVFNHNSTMNGSFANGGFKLSAGASAYHLTRPNYSYLQGGEDDLNIRMVGFVEAEFMFEQSRWGLMPAVYYQRQGKAQEIYLGTYIRYNIINSSQRTDLKDELYVAYGPFYRFGDAFVNKLLIDYQGYAIGFAYDINISSLTQSSKGRGGFEFMFRYTFPESKAAGYRFH